MLYRDTVRCVRTSRGGGVKVRVALNLGARSEAAGLTVRNPPGNFLFQVLVFFSSNETAVKPI
jgi:hypothetical protein